MIQGTWVTNPGSNQAQFDTGDLAVVLLSRTAGNVEPASLPTLGFLDEFRPRGLTRKVEGLE